MTPRNAAKADGMKKMMAALIGLGVFGFGASATAKVFPNPKWNGYALDWCRTFEQGCGKPAADMYCQKKGYPQSTSYVKKNAVSTLTMTVGSNAICNPQFHGCDSFSFIRCQN